MAAPEPGKLPSAQNPKNIVWMWVFAVFWCGISFTLLWAFAFRARDFMGGAIAGLFSLIGLALLYGAVRMTLEYLKFGQVFLSLESAPVSGTSFSANLKLPANAATAATIHAELACVRVTWSRGSKGGVSRSEHDAWTRKNVFPIRRGAVGGYATLRFDVPADQPASNVPGEEDGVTHAAAHPADAEFDRGYYRWEMRAKADVPGIDLERTFPLRVAPGAGGAGAVQAPALAVPPAPVLDPATEARIAARRAAGRRLGLVCAVIAFAPFVIPFSITGLAIGLAGCPASWSTRNPPVCEFAGFNWGPLMTGAFDLVFIAVPVGLIASTLIYALGRLWLDRGAPKGSTGTAGIVGPLVGVAIMGVFFYQAGFLDFAKRRERAPEPPVERAAERAPKRVPERTAPQTAERAPEARAVPGFVLQPETSRTVAVAARGLSAEADGNALRVRVETIRLEKVADGRNAEYVRLGAVVYRRGDWPSRSFGYSWQDVRGVLAPDSAVATLRDHEFRFPGAGSRCDDGGCEVRLLLVVQTAPDRRQREHTTATAVAVAASRSGGF